ncbi:MAG: hypothetical protein LBS69_11950 [Prevotellaceae bacterium]|jgi:hypothetical protein|nr:hypothetical protein [Prevotellaceae bacterium]
MIKKWISAIFLFAIIFVIMFAIYRTINISIVMALGLLAMNLGKTHTKLLEKEILIILVFLSIITIVVTTVLNICNQKELLHIILMCIAIPSCAFLTYYVSKRFLQDKRKAEKNVK